MLWSGAVNRHWKIRKIRYNRPSFKDRDLRHPNLWVGGLLFYEWKPKQLGFLVEKRKAGWTYVMKICKTKKEEVKSPAGSGWASQAPCDKLLHLLKPKFFICTKRRPEQGTYIAAPSQVLSLPTASTCLLKGHPQASRICFAWVHGESEVPENSVITYPKGSP